MRPVRRTVIVGSKKMVLYEDTNPQDLGLLMAGVDERAA